MTKKLAPIVIFIYNRPDHIKKNLAKLIQCKGFNSSPVIIYADGAKNERDYDAVQKTRQVVKDTLGEDAEYHFQEKNIGLANSIIQGVTDVVNRFDKVIVIEDDLIVTTNFLTYMNEALSHYRNDHSVYQISGYQFNVPELAKDNSAFFLPFITSWGWATWKRAWDDFTPETTGWEALQQDKILRKKFNLDGKYDYYFMLLRQLNGKSDSWAIRWYWSVFIKKGVTLYPPVSLVKNVGFDGSGTHGRGRIKKIVTEIPDTEKIKIKLPNTLTIDKKKYTLIKTSIWESNRGWLGYILRKLFHFW